jgi:hypothetical protein
MAKFLNSTTRKVRIADELTLGHFNRGCGGPYRQGSGYR